MTRKSEIHSNAKRQPIHSSSQPKESSEIEKRSSKKTEPMVRLHLRKGSVLVSVANFSASSKMVARRLISGDPIDSLDLDDFSPESVHFVVDFIESQCISGEISFFSLSEILKIAHKLEMAELSRLMEEVLVEQARQSREFLVQALLVAGETPISDAATVLLINFSSEVFLQLAESPNFYRISLSLFLMLLSNCNLNVPDELVVIDAALSWLRRQPFPDQLAVPVFSTIRTSSLDITNYFRIMQQLTELNFPKHIMKDISFLLTSTNSARSCTHKGLGRCNAKDAPLNGKMALSDPKFEEACTLKEPVKKFFVSCEKWLMILKM